MSRLRVLPVVFVSLVFMMSCVVAIPVAIKHYKSSQYYEAKAELPVPAEKVFQAAVSMAEEKPNFQVLEKDDSKRTLKATDGRQTGFLKAKTIDEGATELVVRASLPKEEMEKDTVKELEKELALRIIEQICTRLDVKCTVEEK